MSAARAPNIVLLAGAPHNSDCCSSGAEAESDSTFLELEQSVCPNMIPPPPIDRLLKGMPAFCWLTAASWCMELPQVSGAAGIACHPPPCCLLDLKPLRLGRAAQASPSGRRAASWKICARRLTASRNVCLPRMPCMACPAPAPFSGPTSTDKHTCPQWLKPTQAVLSMWAFAMVARSLIP